LHSQIFLRDVLNLPVSLKGTEPYDILRKLKLFLNTQNIMLIGTRARISMYISRLAMHVPLEGTR
jgi:hypothetical protein